MGFLWLLIVLSRSVSKHVLVELKFSPAVIVAPCATVKQTVKGSCTVALGFCALPREDL